MEHKPFIKRKSYIMSALVIIIIAAVSVIGFKLKGWNLVLTIIGVVFVEGVLAFIFFSMQNISFGTTSSSNPANSKKKPAKNHNRRKGDFIMLKWLKRIRELLRRFKPLNADQGQYEEEVTAKFTVIVNGRETEYNLKAILKGAMARTCGTAKTIELVTLFLQQHPNHVHRRALHIYREGLKKTYEKELIKRARQIDLMSQHEEASQLDWEANITQDIAEKQRSAGKNLTKAMFFVQNTSEVMQEVARRTGYRYGNNLLVDSIMNPRQPLIELGVSKSKETTTVIANNNEPMDVDSIFRKKDEEIEKTVDELFDFNAQFNALDPNQNDNQPEETVIPESVMNLVNP